MYSGIDGFGGILIELNNFDMDNSKLQFLIRNILKSIFLLGIFLAIYLLGKNFIQFEYLSWFDALLNNHTLIIIIFLFSEVFLGILPPELFIMWALQFDQLSLFIALVSLLALISYCSGLIGFAIGLFLNRSLYFRYVKARFLRKLDSQLDRFGIYLILIAALTPLPFSGVCMLVGSVKYSFKRFALIALARFLRFGIYALVFWEANISF